MPRNRKRNDGPAITHTVVIGDPATMWAKLAWDIDNFSMIQRDLPDLMEPLGYAAVNVCISAWSLRQWTWTAHAKRQRQSVKSEQGDFNMRLYAAVPQQQMCEAIANTAKHALFGDGAWPGGSVQIDWHDPTDDDPGGYILRHVHPSGDIDPIALHTFGDLERNWLDFLKELGFDAPHHVYDLEFRQRQLQAMFGPASAWTASDEDG